HSRSSSVTSLVSSSPWTAPRTASNAALLLGVSRAGPLPTAAGATPNDDPAFSGRNMAREATPMHNIHRVTRLLGAIPGCVTGAAAAGAEDWQLDISDSGADDWIEAVSEQEKAGYLEPEKIAVGCSLGELLYVKRYSPAGYSEVSAVRFDASPEVLIRWDRLD